jgi:hypothetical protein
MAHRRASQAAEPEATEHATRSRRNGTHRARPGQANGHAAEPPPAAAEPPPPPAAESNVERAEEMVDRFAKKVSEVTSVVGRKLLKWAARAREEAEDMLAEAKNLRENWRSGPNGRSS